MNIKSGKQVASDSRRRFPKNDTRYWTDRVFKPVNGEGIEGPHYCMRIQFKGKRPCFTTGTGNKDAAARKAQKIYMELLTNGLEATLAAHRPIKKDEKVASDRIATVGEYIAAVRKVSTVDAGTFGSYCRCLRSIVADIVGMKKTSKRFHHGNAAGYREKIDAVLLDVLTPTAIQEWRIRFTKKAKSNPVAQKRARTSCNSVLRQARALFSKKVRPFISLKIPIPPPFADAKSFKRESTRYVSKIDPDKLAQAANRELSDCDPEAFKAFLLALGTALRRGEIDKLMWVQINFKLKVIHLEITEHGDLKSKESDNDVPMDDGLCALLMSYRDKATGPFVIEGAAGVHGEAEYGERYRCENVWNRLIAWLRSHGVDTPKPVHTLRKEAGSIINKMAGIYAASRFLRHRDIQVSAAYYVDNKERTVVDIKTMMSDPNPSAGGAMQTEPTAQTKKPRWKKAAKK